MSSSIGHYQFHSINNEKYSQPFDFFQTTNKSNKLNQNNNELLKKNVIVKIKTSQIVY
jgi:hypothetical protein